MLIIKSFNDRHVIECTLSVNDLENEHSFSLHEDFYYDNQPSAETEPKQRWCPLPTVTIRFVTLLQFLVLFGKFDCYQSRIIPDIYVFMHYLNLPLFALFDRIF